MIDRLALSVCRFGWELFRFVLTRHVDRAPADSRTLGEHYRYSRRVSKAEPI
jgi:hypothetical protein